jgi:hypothetical protein
MPRTAPPPPAHQPYSLLPPPLFHPPPPQGLCNNRMVYLPIALVVATSPRVMDPVGRTWERVLSVTRQPNTAIRLAQVTSCRCRHDRGRNRVVGCVHLHTATQPVVMGAACLTPPPTHSPPPLPLPPNRRRSPLRKRSSDRAQPAWGGEGGGHESWVPRRTGWAAMRRAATTRSAFFDTCSPLINHTTD